jgi:uncharacterized membrane protein YdjX (TVP38/TMEM64 family)
MTVRNLARLALLALIAAGAVAAFRYWDPSLIGKLRDQQDAGGSWAPLLLTGVWLVAPLFFVPGSPVTLAAGALFGPLWGAVYSLIGATGGATLAFLASRYLAGAWVERHLGPRLAGLKGGIEAEGWRFVAFVRLVPLFPFNLLNYALGLTRVPLRTYVITTFACMAPGAAAFAYLGYAGRAALEGSTGWVTTAITALGASAALALLPFMIRRWKAPRTVQPLTLAQWLRDGRDVQVVDVRSLTEYQGPEGHIAPSLAIPVETLDSQLEELGHWKLRPIVVL